MTIAVGIELPEAAIAEICRRHQVRELSLFGSAARGDMRPDSDIDLLVDFLPGARPGLLGVLGLMREVTALLGRRVDLALPPATHPLVAGPGATGRLGDEACVHGPTRAPSRSGHQTRTEAVHPAWRASRGPADLCGVTSRDRKSTRLNSSHRCISYAV